MSCCTQCDLCIVSISIQGLCAGVLLRSLTFPSAIHSIRTDPGDHALYAGSGDGRIFETSLVGEVAGGEGSGEQHEAGYYTMEGQNAAVTCLAMTTDANQMVSGAYRAICLSATLSCMLVKAMHTIGSKAIAAAAAEEQPDFTRPSEISAWLDLHQIRDEWCASVSAIPGANANLELEHLV